MFVEPRSDPFLHAFDDRLIFQFDTMKIRPRSFVIGDDESQKDKPLPLALKKRKAVEDSGSPN